MKELISRSQMSIFIFYDQFHIYHATLTHLLPLKTNISDFHMINH